MACGKTNDGLSDLMECCICAEKYSDPRVLPCIHTFCLKCLEKVGVGKHPGDIMVCPLCRGEFKIPDNGFEGIQKNFFMEKLMDLHGISTGSSRVTLCDACQKDDLEEQVPVAVVICFECNQKLCEHCVQLHRKSEALKHHQLADFKNKDNMNQMTMKLVNGFCVHHPSEPIKLFCLDCNTANCSVCQFENHDGHKCSSAEKIGGKLRLQLESHIELISACSELSRRELLNKLDEQERSLLNCTDTIEIDVLRRAGQMIEKIDQDAKKLLEELRLITKQKQKEIQTMKEELSRLVTMLESYERYAIEMKERGSAVDICRTYQDMIVRAEELQKKHRDINCYCDADTTSSHSISKMVTFYPTDNRTAAENVIGEIHYEPWQLPDHEIKTQYGKNMLLPSVTAEYADVDPIGLSRFKICLEESEITSQTLFPKHDRDRIPEVDLLSNMSGNSRGSSLFQESIIRSQCQVMEMNKPQNVPRRRAKKAEKAKELDANEIIYNRIRMILNMLKKAASPKFQHLIRQLRTIPINTEERLTTCVDIIHEKAVSKPNFFAACAHMAKGFMHVKVHSEADPTVVISFRTILMDKCQLEFEKDTDASEEANHDSSLEKQKKDPKAHARFLGNIRFIGELFKLKLVSMKIMQECLKKLLTFGNDENTVKCFCELLTNIGRDINKIQFKEFMDGCFDQLEHILSDTTTSKCLQTAIQEVIELRNNDWLPPLREENNLEKIEQVNSKVEQEGKVKHEVSGLLPPRQQENNLEKIEQVNPKMEQEGKAKREIIRNVEVLQRQLETFKKELGNFLFRNEHTA